MEAPIIGLENHYQENRAQHSVYFICPQTSKYTWAAAASLQSSTPKPGT